MRFNGYIDSLEGSLIRGWLGDSRKAVRLEFDLFYDDKYIGRYSTGFARPDIPNNYSKDPFCGFQIRVQYTEISDPSLIEIVVFGYRFKPVLQKSGLYKFVFIRKWKKNDLKKIFSTPVYSLHRDVQADFWNKFSKETAADDEFQTSDFGRFLRQKYSEVKKLDRTGFYRWYLEIYNPGLNWKSPAILSEEESKSIFSIERNGFTLYTNKISRNAPHVTRRALASQLSYKAYWWACMESSRLSLGSSTLPQFYHQTLSSLKFQFIKALPINEFMVEFMRGSNRAIIPALNCRVATLYAELMIRGLRNQVYLRLLPADGIAAMLDETSGHSKLSTVIREWGGGDAEKIVSLVRELVYGPAIAEPLPASTDVQYFAPFNSITGLGETSRRFAQAMLDVDCNVSFVNIEQNNSAQTCELSFPVANPTLAKINIIQINMDAVPEFFACHHRLLSNSYNVVIPFWELSRFSECHSLGISLADEIWGASEFICRSFSNDFTNIQYIGHPARKIPLSATRLDRRVQKETRPFKFLNVFDALSWTSRKNPVAVVKAFQIAFPKDDLVSLTIKTQNADVVTGIRSKEINELKAMIAEDHRASFLDLTLSDEEQRKMLAEADCLVSLHRAEGLGIDMLDCLYSDIPVVCTNYSGNTDFCQIDTAWVVDYSLIRVEHEQYCYVNSDHVWADPSLPHAAAALRQVYQCEDDRNSKRYSAMSKISSNFSSVVVGKRIREHVSRILGGR